MAYKLGYVCQSLDTPDGFMAITNKATLVHHLSNEHLCLHSMNKEALYIEDGNATYYCIKDIPENFKLICLKMFDENCPHKANVVFSIDTYHQNSINPFNTRLVMRTSSI